MIALRVSRAAWVTDVVAVSQASAIAARLRAPVEVPATPRGLSLPAQCFWVYPGLVGRPSFPVELRSLGGRLLCRWETFDAFVAAQAPDDEPKAPDPPAPPQLLDLGIGGDLIDADLRFASLGMFEPDVFAAWVQEAYMPPGGVLVDRIVSTGGSVTITSTGTISGPSTPADLAR